MSLICFGRFIVSFGLVCLQGGRSKSERFGCRSCGCQGRGMVTHDCKKAEQRGHCIALTTDVCCSGMRVFVFSVFFF